MATLGGFGWADELRVRSTEHTGFARVRVAFRGRRPAPRGFGPSELKEQFHENCLDAANSLLSDCARSILWIFVERANLYRHVRLQQHNRVLRK